MRLLEPQVMCDKFRHKGMVNWLKKGKRCLTISWSTFSSRSVSSIQGILKEHWNDQVPPRVGDAKQCLQPNSEVTEPTQRMLGKMGYILVGD